MRAAGCSVVVAAALLAGAAGAAGSPVTIATPGFWSLARLGAGELRLHESPRNGQGEAKVAFRLPAGAHQGAGQWYVVRVHAIVSLRRDSLPGTFELAADTGGRTSVSVNFTVAKRHGKLALSSDFLGLVNGVERTSGSSLSRELDVRNFLVASGVRPGTNVLTLRLNASAAPMVREVRILPDSGIELGTLGPARVALAAHVREHDVHVGDTFHLDFSLRRVSGRTVPSAKLRAVFPGDLVSGGAGFRTFRWGTSSTLHGTFALRARRAGRAPLGVDAAVAGTFPSASALVYIDPRR